MSKEGNMKPSVLKDVLVTAFQNRQNILITGAPGIGKSDLTHQAVIAADGNLILSHPVCSDPTGFKKERAGKGGFRVHSQRSLSMSLRVALATKQSVGQFNYMKIALLRSH